MDRIPAVIIDLDGTLVANQYRLAVLYSQTDYSKIDWDKWNEESRFDPHAIWCLELVSAMSKHGYHILFVTGRSGTPITEAITREWLSHHVPGHIDWSIIFRPPNDHRNDNDIKYDLYLNQIEPIYEVLFAVDDRKINAEMWRSLGITALQCAEF